MNRVTEKYKARFETALSHQSEQREDFKRWIRQFEGSTEIEGGEAAKLCYNFTKELIESQINPNVPGPSVSHRRPTEQNRELAENIAAMLRCELNKMPFEAINDMEERLSRIMGASLFLVEWDNTEKTGDTVGELAVRLLSPLEFVPQPGVLELYRMDYFFLVFDDTKERLFTRYGIPLSETVDPRFSEISAGEDETVTQIICFFKNKTSGYGAVSWAGDTELFCEENYHTRKKTVCIKCKKTRISGEKECGCGGKFVKKNMHSEILCEDIIRKDGSVIPTISPQKDDEGNIILQAGACIGKTEMSLRLIPTAIDYYIPKNFPISLRRNCSMPGRFFGSSDCVAIAGLQIQANKALTKIDEKLVSSGYIMTKPEGMQFELSNKMGKVLSVQGPDQLAMLRAIAFEFNASADFFVLDKSYQMAKSVLGVTDSFQGKGDKAALSGKAKELLIAQSAGIQRTKQVLKNAAYADLFRAMFETMLCFADEPRIYSKTDINGEEIQRVFNRYDFLKQDETGRWYYDDDFLFSVDETGSSANDKTFLLEDVRTDFGLGAFGNPTQPQTLLMYWKEKEVLGYPNAKRMVKYWQEKIESSQDMQSDLSGLSGGDADVMQ